MTNDELKVAWLSFLIPHSSFLPNPGRAACEEGADALARLARLEALELRLGLVLEHPLQALVLAHVDGALGGGDRGRRRVAQALRQSSGLGGQLGVREDAVDEAEVVCAPR